MGENNVFQKMAHAIIALGSPQTTENNEFLFKNIIAMHWTHQIALCHQPCHGGFTVLNHHFHWQCMLTDWSLWQQLKCIIIIQPQK